MTMKQYKTLMTVLVVVLVVIFIGIIWGIDAYFDTIYYKEGDYSNHTCDYTVDKCSNEAMCKMRDGSFVRYYCSEHASFAKEHVDRQTKNTGTGSNSSRTAKCKSCGRKFEAGDSAGNFMNIAKTGMCNNCCRNYEYMSGLLGK